MKKFWKKRNKNKNKSLEKVSTSTESSRNFETLDEAQYKTKTELLIEHLKELEEKNDELFEENAKIIKENSKKETEIANLNYEIITKKRDLEKNDNAYLFWKKRYTPEAIKLEEEKAMISNQKLVKTQEKLKSENEILVTTLNTLKTQNEAMKEKIKGFKNEKNQEQRDLEAR